LISVVIPALNEAETVACVVRFAHRDPAVGEVIVVDNGSTDSTPELAHAAGAVVLSGSMAGKGASMADGARAARYEVVLYLYADMVGLRRDLVGLMTSPIVEGRADFVKARVSRHAGRVTALTARPLLRALFPELAHIHQPLGGVLAARRGLLQGLSFEDDYGVDVGLLLDAAAAGARLLEVEVGHIEHDNHPLEALGDMAAQVARAILVRAARRGRLRGTRLMEAEEAELHRRAELPAILEKTGKAERVALLDMDGTLLDGRFIVHLAGRTDRLPALGRVLDNPELPPGERTCRIASLFAGVPRAVFERTARDVPLMAGAREMVVGLRKMGYRVGVVTDSFHITSEVVRRRVFADFSVAHLARFHHGKATGKVMLSPVMAHPEGCPHHPHCKANVLLHLHERTGLGAERVLAVGAGENDVCLLRAAGRSFAFRPRTEEVRAAAGGAVVEDLMEVLSFLQGEREVAIPPASGLVRKTG
jgi:glucosyl-3-phosphoglycerate synthase